MSIIVSEKAFDYLVSRYIPSARWWPWKGVSHHVIIRAREASGELEVFLLESAGKTFYLPLLRVSTIPEELSSRAFCVDSECYVEAEYNSTYLERLRRFSSAWFKEFDGFSASGLSVLSARPVTLGSTNAVVEYLTSSGSLVIKSYRLLSETNLEVKVLERLAGKGYRYIPRLRSLVYFGKYPTGVLMDKVAGEADGGAPFYRALTSYLAGDERSEKTGLSSKLGVLIGEMHIALNKDGDDPFFGVEPVSGEDVEFWCKRVETMASAALSRMDKLLDTLPPVERGEIEYWRGVMENRGLRVVEDALSRMDEMMYLYKGRIHQDLHLAQMVYTGDGVVDFVITDFEGEPGRSERERLAKEPLIRDIATMIRSFHYLAHAALENYHGLSKHKTSLLMLERDPTFTWRLKHVVSMTYSYTARILGSGILSPRELSVVSNPWVYLYPWIVERAVYELYYESMYRPGWVSVPIAGLVEAPLYRVAPRRV